MTLSGGISYNDTIQSAIDQHVQDPNFARFVCCLSNISGSFNMPENFLLTVQNGSDITCSGNGGHNELTLINCTNVTITDFFKGVLRLEGCSNVTLINCGENVKFVVAGTDIQQATFGENSEIGFMGGSIQQLTMTNPRKAFTQKCTIEQLTQTGGVYYSEGDTFSGQVQVETNAKGTFVNPQFSGQYTQTDSSVTMHNPTLKTATIQSGFFTMNGGTYETLEIG